MRRILLVFTCLAVAGCLEVGSKKPVETAQAAPVTKVAVPTTDSQCYTVVLFSDAKVEKPAKDVPEVYKRFLGSWTGGAWNGVWCHDLLVTKVHNDGRVELYEMHAPYEPWAQPATAFKRIGRIDENGRLRFAYGTETVTYEMIYGQLKATRAGVLGNLKATLARPGAVPIPPPRPTQLVQAPPVTPGT